MTKPKITEKMKNEQIYFSNNNIYRLYINPAICNLPKMFYFENLELLFDIKYL